MDMELFGPNVSGVGPSPSVVGSISMVVVVKVLLSLSVVVLLVPRFAKAARRVKSGMLVVG